MKPGMFGTINNAVIANDIKDINGGKICAKNVMQPEQPEQIT